MFDVFWAISSDNGLKKKKLLSSGTAGKLFRKMTKVNFYFQCVWWPHSVQVLHVKLVTSYSSRSFHEV